MSWLFSGGYHVAKPILDYVPGTLQFVRWCMTPKEPVVPQALPKPLFGKGVKQSSQQPLPTHGWIHDSVTGFWKLRSEAEMEAECKPTHNNLNILTYNIMMDLYERHNPGVIHSDLRYAHVIQLLTERDDLDVISLNEVDKVFLAMLCADPVVQERFALTEVSPQCVDATNAAVEPGWFRISKAFSVLVLVRRSVSITAVSAAVSRSGPRACIAVTLAPAPQRTVVIVGVHFVARVANFERRFQQIYGIYRALRLSNVKNCAKAESLVTIEAEQAVILGDFNLHQESESVMIQEPFVDLWTLLKPNASEDEGYTWNAQQNTLIQAMFLRVDDRRMRLDRVISNLKDGKDVLIPMDMELFGTQPISNCEIDYLYPSDHYGLLTKFKVAKQ